MNIELYLEQFSIIARQSVYKMNYVRRKLYLTNTRGRFYLWKICRGMKDGLGGWNRSVCRLGN